MFSRMSSWLELPAAKPVLPAMRAEPDAAAGNFDPGGRLEMLRAKILHFISIARRHGLSAFGPLSVSGAHFVAALLLLHKLPSAAYGQFSFVIIMAALGLSLTNGLLGAPVSSMATSTSPDRKRELNTYAKTGLVLALAWSVAVFLTMLSSRTPLAAAGLFGAYAGAMSLRLFARTHSYTMRHVRKVIVSDCTYSVTLVCGLSNLAIAHRISLGTTALVMASGALLAILPFGLSFVGVMIDALRSGSVRAYGRIWTDMTRWSLLGVVTTEVTINAHAYLVTFLCGPQAFALLAAGSLFMRPFSLIASALPDQERPAMSRSIAAGDTKTALRISREFLYAISAIWFATALAAAAVLVWFPQLIMKKGFDHTDMVCVVVLFGIITAVRGIRAPDAVLLQAARAFRPLADASTQSSIVALIATLALLLVSGPIASLGGILIGDVVMWAIVVRGVRQWKATRN
jgi:hypothetical protein